MDAALEQAGERAAKAAKAATADAAAMERAIHDIIDAMMAEEEGTVEGVEAAVGVEAAEGSETADGVLEMTTQTDVSTTAATRYT